MKYTLFILILYFINIKCTEIKDQIYYEVPTKSISHCVRRLNATSSVGCSSKSNGNIGIIEVALDEFDLYSKLISIKEDTIFIINTKLFIKPNITNQIITNKFVTGLIIFEQDKCLDLFCEINSPKSFSEDYKIPNSLYSFSINETFNPPGTKYAFTHWPFPVALMGRKHKIEQEKILSCYNKYNVNSTSPRKCALEIKNFMAAVKSSLTCIEYENIQSKFAGLFHPTYFCDDFYGKNYAVHTIDKIKRRSNNSVIVLMSRLDSLSMFEKSAVANIGAVTSAALLLSVMKLLYSQTEFQNNTEKLKKDVLFLFLDNESYDYLGSHRFFSDIHSNKIANSSSSPINATHFDLLLEFGELGLANFTGLNFFYPPKHKLSNDSARRTETYLKRLSNQLERHGFSNPTSRDSLPPSSIQFFLRQRAMPAIVLGDHSSKFHNQFYNSFLDNGALPNNSLELVAIVNAVASFVFQEATGQPGANLSRPMEVGDLVTPANIVQCFTENIRCPLLRNVLPNDVIDKLAVLDLPVPTQTHSSSTEAAQDYRFSFLLVWPIVSWSGRPENVSVCNACPDCAHLTKINIGNHTELCYRTKIDLANEFWINSRHGPRWVTSLIVDKQSIRMFVQAPNTGLLATGLALTALALVVMSLLSSRMSEIFQSCDP